MTDQIQAVQPLSGPALAASVGLKTDYTWHDGLPALEDGYIAIKVGEFAKPGDQYWDSLSQKWFERHASHGPFALTAGSCFFRRKIQAEVQIPRVVIHFLSVTKYMTASTVGVVWHNLGMSPDLWTIKRKMEILSGADTKLNDGDILEILSIRGTDAPSEEERLRTQLTECQLALTNSLNREQDQRSQIFDLERRLAKVDPLYAAERERSKQAKSARMFDTEARGLLGDEITLADSSSIEGAQVVDYKPRVLQSVVMQSMEADELANEAPDGGAFDLLDAKIDEIWADKAKK